MGRKTLVFKLRLLRKLKHCYWEIMFCIDSFLSYTKLDSLKWYCEYGDRTRIHDYINIMVNNFPIFTIRKLDNPHSENKNLDRVILIGILGFTKTF